MERWNGERFTDEVSQVELVSICVLCINKCHEDLNSNTFIFVWQQEINDSRGHMVSETLLSVANTCEKTKRFIVGMIKNTP